MMTTATNSSSSAQLRKIKKPMIERRRRERINDCLNQLKSLVLEASNKDESRYSKMEKADILEMTVSHLRALHRRPCHQLIDQTSSSSSSSAEAADRYLDGFKQCAVEVGRYLAQSAVAGSGSPSSSSSMTAAASLTPIHQQPQLMIGARLMRHLTSLLLHSSATTEEQSAIDEAVGPFKSVAVDDEHDRELSLTLSSPDRRVPETVGDVSGGHERFLTDLAGSTPFERHVSACSVGLSSIFGGAIEIKKEVNTGQSTYGIRFADSTSLTSWAEETTAGTTANSQNTPRTVSPTSLAQVVSGYCNNGSDAFSPKQADEVPIHRQLTSVASSHSRLPFPPPSAWFLSGKCSSTIAHNKPLFVDGDLDLPVFCCGGDSYYEPGSRELHSSDVWRPW